MIRGRECFLNHSLDTLAAPQALLLLKAAWDLGINTIDTANTYSNGDAERTIAAFIDKVCIPFMHVRLRVREH